MKMISMSSFFGATTEDIEKANLITLGIPWDASSSFRKGCAKGPNKIRQAHRHPPQLLFQI